MKKLPAILLLLIVSACKKDKIGYTVPVIDPTSTYDNRSVGLSGNDYLSSARFKAINLDIVYVSKHAPSDSFINATVDFLKTYCNKPAGIRVTKREVGMQGGDLGVNQLSTVEKLYRTRYSVDGNNDIDTIGLFVFISEANYYDKSVLGIAYKNTSVALFDGTIQGVSGGVLQPTRTDVMTSVLQHEIGHVFGLVNIGAPMQTNHEDATHGKHCDNKNCLMYYTMQTTDIVSTLLKGMPQLDSNCIADLKANGSK